MKGIFILSILLLTLSTLFAAGVVINKEASTLQPIHLQSCHYQADVQNQIALVTVTETFINYSYGNIAPRYYFPTPSGASPTQLRWFVHNQWYHASIAGNPQNPSGGPSSFPAYFNLYLGFFPLVFDFQTSLQPNEQIVVEYTYVQLLNYSFGNVNLLLKNNYTAIQNLPVQLQQVDITIQSDRLITECNLNNTHAVTINNGYTATSHLVLADSVAASNFGLNYRLATNSTSMRVLSTMRDSIPDNYGHGFFTCLVEPASGAITDSLPLKITLVVDHSGSMNNENRIVQARAAVIYIMNHLNSTDRFNVISFDHQVQTLWSTHQYPTASTIAAATQWVNNISAVAPNGTNISGALDSSISQFVGSNSSYRNVIMLITDGGPTVGITDTYQLVNHVHAQLNSTNIPNFSLFTFGIGTDINTQLLNLLAQGNNGSATFVGSSDLFAALTSFYDSIHNPVISNPVFSTLPGNVITEIYPNPIPNLYQDTQIVITGRYQNPQTVGLHFNGVASGQPTSLNYTATLNANADSLLQFVPKLWASKKIDYLLLQYYLLSPQSAAALELRSQIVNLSQYFGVVCVFTSFTTPTETDDVTDIPAPAAIRLLGNYPNPFNPSTTIRFQVLQQISGPAFVEIFNMKGQLVRNLAIRITGKGDYEVMWDGKNNQGKPTTSGIYFYKIRIDKYLLTGKMTMLK